MEGCLAAVTTGILSLMFIGLGYPLARGKVPPNSWYGYRLNRPTLEDEDIWYAVNRAGGAHLVYLGTALLPVALLSLFFLGEAGAQAVLALVATAVVIASMTASIIYTYRLSHRMAKEKSIP